MNRLQMLDKEKCILVSTILFVVVITLFAWQSDDAYHAYVMAKHLVEGYGFVYNIGERATASTCPLFTLIIAFGYLVFRNMYLVSLFICILFSTLAFIVVVKCFCKTSIQVIATFFSFVFSGCFISFTTSGLENCLLFFLAALFLKIYINKSRYNSKCLFGLAFLLSLIAMTRMDMVLAFVPAVVFAFLFKREKCSFIKAVFIGFAGLMPFVLWELFATFYYGFPFPNTYYAKLGTGISLFEYLYRGNEYYVFSFLFDPLVVLIPFIAILIAFARKNKKMIACVLGILLYLGYLLYIGGDFMVGRLFTVVFFISIIVILWFVNDIDNKKRFTLAWASIIVVSLVFSLLFRPVVSSRMHPNGPIADERGWYMPYTGLINNAKSYISTGHMVLWDTWNNESEFYELMDSGENDRYFVSWAAGIMVYEYSDYYLNDLCALGDPFLSKLPAVWTEGWRIGHLYRDVPAGYCETVYYDQNMIQNESLSEYYEIIKLITRGPLFSQDRIIAIFDVNTGKYDYLIDDYASTLDENNCQLP